MVYWKHEEESKEEDRSQSDRRGHVGPPRCNPYQDAWPSRPSPPRYPAPGWVV